MNCTQMVILLGDSRYSLPLALAIACALFAFESSRIATKWILSFLVGLVIILLAKFAYDYGGFSIPSLRLYSVSGHAMRASVVYPSIFALIGLPWGARAKNLGFVSGCIISTWISFGLVVCDFHTISEVIVGVCIGSTIAYWNIKAWRFLLPLRGALFRTLVAIFLVAIPAVIFGEYSQDLEKKVWAIGGDFLGVSARHYRVIVRGPERSGVNIAIGTLPRRTDRDAK